MIIRDIHIDGFGIFRDFSFTSLQKGINIFVGNNEAGKSTLLKFLRYTLFGYPRPKEQRMQPLSGNVHGGRINALMQSGEEVVFERMGTNRTKLFINGQEGAADEKWSLLLGNATDALYNNIYAFTLDELVGMGSLEKSGVEDKIFSMGLGLGNVSLSDVEGSVASFTDNLYTSRGKIQKVPLILRDLASLRAEILQNQENLDQYREITAAITQLNEQTAQTAEEVKQLQNDFSRLQTLLLCYESFVQYNTAKKELEILPPLQDYPEKGPAEMESTLRELDEIEQRKINLQNGTPEEKGILELEEILNNSEVNQSLLENRDNVEFIRLNQTLYKDTLKQRQEESEKLSDLNRQIEGSLKNQINPHWDEMAVNAFDKSALHQNRVEQFALETSKTDNQLREWEAHEKAVMANLPSINLEAIVRLSALIFLLASVPAFYYNILVLGIVLVVIGFTLFFGRKAFRKKDPRIPIREKLRELSEERKAVVAQYRDYLQKELRLSPDLPFQAVPGVLQAIAQTKKMIVERDRIREKIQEHRLPFLYEFEGKVKSMKDLIVRDVSSADIISAARVIIEEYDQGMEVYSQLLKLAEELQRKKKESDQLDARMEQVEQKMKKLLEIPVVETAEAFFEKYNENNKVKELTVSLKNALEKIETVAGVGKAEEVITFLSQHEKQVLQQQADALAPQLEEKKEALAQLHTQIGAKRTEKDRLAGESELSEKLTRQETFRQQLREVWKEWMAGMMAQKVLQDVKSSYEQEKQPEVIKNAGLYFKNITSGVYSGIRTSIEGKQMHVYDAREGSKTLDQLSRGTKEQLLLCLRLGFIKEYETKAEPLPLVTDEILVNFDRKRAEKAAQILQDFAEDRQVLVFTCHSFTQQFFDEDRIKVFQIGNP